MYVLDGKRWSEPVHVDVTILLEFPGEFGPKLTVVTRWEVPQGVPNSKLIWRVSDYINFKRENLYEVVKSANIQTSSVIVVG
jgi:hypothetical protein